MRKNKKTSEDCTNFARETKIAAGAYGCITKSLISNSEQKILTV